MSEQDPYTEEVWKTIAEFPLYSVSSFGRVKSHHTTIGRLLKITPDKTTGYCRVKICQYGQQNAKSVHLLVADAFLAPEPDRPEVNHGDGVKTNNRLDNLKRCTRSYNVQHAFSTLGRVSLKGTQHGRSKLSNEDVVKIKILLASGEEPCDIAPLFGVTYGAVWQIDHGRTWTHVVIPNPEDPGPNSAFQYRTVSSVCK